ncbi:phage tail protein I [uncultured Shewanella sp.]|uniref:phage tail protein I n=1 Tax=uncultured Shewanella sp. TaxID=173975 RepID=UPI00262B140B|nr:phage tail protein I [uncultured Shewanella sp.]
MKGRKNVDDQALSALPQGLQTHSVLPDNRSALERGLELALARQLNGIEHPFPDLLNGKTTSNANLPYLAAERQLTVWDENDEPHIKQNLVSQAWEVKRLGGTRGGLKKALASLDFDSEITPWYRLQEQNAKPYFLDIVAWKKGNRALDMSKLHKLQRYIQDNKSERDDVSLSLMFGVETQLGLAGAAAPVTNVVATESTATMWPMPHLAAKLTLGGGAIPPTNMTYVSAQAVT